MTIQARLEHFGNFDDVIGFSQEEQKRVYRISLPGLIQKVSISGIMNCLESRGCEGT